MRWIQFVFLTASLVSLFVIRPPRTSRKVIRALDELASESAYGREDSSSNGEGPQDLHNRR